MAKKKKSWEIYKTLIVFIKFLFFFPLIGELVPYWDTFLATCQWLLSELATDLSCPDSSRLQPWTQACGLLRKPPLDRQDLLIGKMTGGGILCQLIPFFFL